MRRLFAMVFCALAVSACNGGGSIQVKTDPTDADILVSESDEKRDDFAKAGSGTATIPVEFKKDEQGKLLPVRIRVKKEGYAPQTFLYRQGDSLPGELDVKLETIVIVEVRELEKSSAGGFRETIRMALSEVEEVERSPNVKSVTRVTHFRREDKKDVFSLDISPDTKNPLIVFDLRETEEVKEREKDVKSGKDKDVVKSVTFVNLWLTKVGETGITRLTYGKTIGRDKETETWGDRFPTFSKEGDYIFFSSNRSGNAYIWRTRAGAAGGITRISSGSGNHYEPNPLKDKLFFSEYFGPDRSSLMWMSNLDGGLPTMLREGTMPRTSPDGTKVLFLLEDRNSKDPANSIIRTKLDEKSNPVLRDGKPVTVEIEMPAVKIWVMNIDGTNPTQLTFGNTTEKTPSWSPDGKKILLSSNMGKDSKGRNNYDIWSMNAEGTQLTQLTTNGSEDDYPIWEPGGKYIYFRSNRGGGAYNIWRMEPAQ